MASSNPDSPFTALARGLRFNETPLGMATGGFARRIGGLPGFI